MRPSLSSLLTILAACSAPAPPTGAEPADTETVERPGRDGPAWDDGASLRDNCWPDLGDDRALFPVYDDLGIVPGHHCSGTNHQEISGVEKVVFLGDSVTAGTPPTPVEQYFRTLLETELRARFGDSVEFADCSEWGARTDDYLPRQIPRCFPGIEEKRTLVLATMGGNDAFAAASRMLDGGSAADALEVLDRAIAHQRDAMRWFVDNEAERFPAGVFVVVSNVYEFTDATSNLSSCPTADYLGFGGFIPELRDGYIYLNEAFVEIAAETQTDILFLLESFCGHGFYAGDPENECYRGHAAQVWFDGTCIHPNPVGHRAIADLFLDVIDE